LSARHQFAEEKLKDLVNVWKFRLSCPWYVPEEQIRMYYGEKIALYFSFLSYYTQMLFPMGIISIAAGIFQLQFEWNSEQYVFMVMLFGMISVVWTNYFIFSWQSKE
jgi:anoctamin-10